MDGFGTAALAHERRTWRDSRPAGAAHVRNVYGSRIEVRPALGDGRPPGTGDIRRAVRLSRAVRTAAAILATVGPLVRSRRR